MWKVVNLDEVICDEIHRCPTCMVFLANKMRKKRKCDL